MGRKKVIIKILLFFDILAYQNQCPKNWTYSVTVSIISFKSQSNFSHTVKRIVSETGSFLFNFVATAVEKPHISRSCALEISLSSSNLNNGLYDTDFIFFTSSMVWCILLYHCFPLYSISFEKNSRKSSIFLHFLLQHTII